VPWQKRSWIHPRYDVSVNHEVQTKMIYRFHVFFFSVFHICYFTEGFILLKTHMEHQEWGLDEDFVQLKTNRKARIYRRCSFPW
jgi:hypothetical protein